MPSITVGFIVHPPTNEVMLHLRGPENDPFPNMWAAIGGHEEPEDNGNLSSTLLRELEEELLLALPLSALVLLEQRPQCEIYLVIPGTKEINPEIQEGLDCRWFGFSEALDLENLAPVTRADLPLVESAVRDLADR